MHKPQNYKNHIRFYPPHHFVFYPVMLALFSAAVTQIFIREGYKLVWIFIAVIIAVITWLAYMLRQHYALTLQNRIVLMELRYRYFVITGQRLEPLEQNLTEGQLFALRFAADDELEELAGRAVRENLTPDAIKRAVVNWKADHRRV
jgi:hypothetical protein